MCIDLQTLGLIDWNPNRWAFTIPGIDHPVAWYGLCFAGGIAIAYLLFRRLLSKILLKTAPESISLVGMLSDRLLIFVLFGVVVGARTAHLLFYDWDYFSRHPSEFFMIWHGGLASHGGVVGLLLALACYRLSIRKQFPRLSFLLLIDLLALPAALAAVCIRLGNFINQELVGTPSDLPWAVRFLHPMEGVAPLSRHPVQLYEAASYGLIALLLAAALRWQMRRKWRPGLLSGLCLTLVFSARLLLEPFKIPLSSLIDESQIRMGQWLSLPLLLLGAILLFRAVRAPLKERF